MDLKLIEKVDHEIADAIIMEMDRQKNTLELIASENIASPAVMAVQGSVFTNKYAEGYPDKRYYGGCEYVDIAENLAINRVKKIIQCRLCQCPAPLRITGKYGGIFCSVRAGRHGSWNEFVPRRAPYTRKSGQFFRKAL